MAEPIRLGWLSELVRVAALSLVQEADTQSSELLHQHQEWVASVRTRCLEEQRRRERLAAESSYRANSASPVHRLPPELFTDILLASLGDYWDNQIPRLRELASVGRHWYDAVLATPSFWESITGRMSRVQVGWALRWSRTSKLDIRLTHRQCRSIWDQTENLEEASHRWESLSVQSNHSLPKSIHRGLAKGTPMLDWLDLTCYSASGNYRRVERIALGNCSHLKFLTLKNVSLPWASSNLSGLLYLRIVEPGEFAPTIREVMDVLAACPDLQTLHLVAIRFKDFGSPLQPADTDGLPSVKHLRLEDVKISEIRHDVYALLLRLLPWSNCFKIWLNPHTPKLADELFDHSSVESGSLAPRILCNSFPIHVTLSERSASVMTSDMWVARNAPKKAGLREEGNEDEEGEDKDVDEAVPLGFGLAISLCDGILFWKMLQQLRSLLEIENEETETVLHLTKPVYAAPSIIPHWLAELHGTLSEVHLSGLYPETLKATLTDWVDPKKTISGGYTWNCPWIRVINLGKVTTAMMEELSAIAKPRWEVVEAVADPNDQRRMVEVLSMDEAGKPREALKWRLVSEWPSSQAEESS